MKQLSTVNISIDDFYLTREEQQRVADTSGNRLLQVRGNAGTHDLALGAETIAALKDSALKSRAEGVRVPRYNKSASGGKGDRHPIEQWPEVAAGEGTGVDIILFEGWMLGFTPLEEKDGDLGDLQMIDDQLGAYKSWNDVVDAWMVVRIEDLDCVYDWRMQAERKMRSEGKVGMSDDEVRYILYLKKCVVFILLNIHDTQLNTTNYDDHIGSRLCGPIHAGIQGISLKALQGSSDAFRRSKSALYRC